MSGAAHAREILLKRLGSGTTALLALVLDLPAVPAWCDGRTSDGRAILLVGSHQLKDSPDGEAVKTTILAMMAEDGEVPESVRQMTYAPAASAFIAEAVAGMGREILADGPRGTGKTQAVPAILAALAERHARAGYDLPLRVVWLHDSLKNAEKKTGRSLEKPLWGGLWSLRDDRSVAVFTLAGTEMVSADFVGVRDEAASERLRAECSVLAAEELIASLEDAGGIDKRKYELGLSSMRVPSARHVAVSTTNPGAPESWPFQRWLEGGGQIGCVRMQIPATDRLTEDERANLLASFTDSDLQARLARGEWAGLILGATVAVGFQDAHVASAPIPVHRGLPLVLGHDGGHTPVTVIGQLVGGSVHILAALASLHDGTDGHIRSLVKPWLQTHAPWATGPSASAMQLHFYDPSMATGDQSNIQQNPVLVIEQVLGGSTYEGAISWPGRIEPLIELFTRLNPATGKPVFQIDPSGEGCANLITALRGRWFYPMVDGQVRAKIPMKNHPWSDLGDGLCYLVGGAMPDAPARPVEIKVESDFDPRVALAGVGGR